MEKKAISVVELEAPSLGNERRTFSIEHAERLFGIPNSGWQLPADSKFIYSKENGFTGKSNKGTTEGSL